MRARIRERYESALYSMPFETNDGPSLQEFMQAAIGPLPTHDLQRGTELAGTLLAYSAAS